MNIVTVDFETYYDSEYSLRKMTTIEYIMSPLFQPIMMSYAIDDEPIRTAIGYPQIRDVLASIDWNNTILNAQNTIFDGTIIKQRFGYEARYYADTMAMARVTGAHIFDGASLDAIAKVLQAVGYAVPPKGKAVASASGKRLYDMYEAKPYLAEHSLTNPADIEQAHQLLKAYQEYCENDVLLAKQAFLYFSSLVTPSEMMYSDMILKCYILPQMKLDLPIIQEEIKRIEIRDVNRATDMANKYFEGSIPALRATCRSAVKFTEFLHQLGGRLEYELNEGDDYYFLIPYKYSEKKGKNEPCYSKSYAGMMEMCDHPDPDIADIFKMKLAMTSSIEMSRAKRFESIAQLGVGFGMPYSVSGAHTHRLGGCVTGDTKIIVKSPDYDIAHLIPIKELRNIDLVWNGSKWCTHEGLVYKGLQKVSYYDGLVATDDHIVVTKEGLMPFGWAKQNKCPIKNGKQPRYPKKHSVYFKPYTMSNHIMCKDCLRELPTEYYRLSAPKNSLGIVGKFINLKELFDDLVTGRIDYAYFKYLYKKATGYNYQPQFKERVEPVYDILNVGEEHIYWANGKLIHNSGGLNVQNLSSGRKEGQSNALKRSITAPAGYKVVVFDSSQIELRTGSFIADDQNTLYLFRTGKDPYSVQAAQLYGGDPDEIKKNAKAHIEPFAMQRQLAKSALLSCIYGTGAGGFENYLKVNGLHQTLDECKFIVNNYRQTHPEIVRMWKECERVLNGMLAGDSGYFGGADGQLFFYDGSRKVHARVVPGIRLPDGNWLNYYNLRQEPREYPDGSVSMNYAYTGLKEGRIKTIYTYASKIFENINQAFAFSIMKYQAMLVNERYRVALNTHDEWGIVVPDAEVEQASEYMAWCMRQVPDWAKGLPVDCEGNFAQHYGDCK